MRQKILLVNPNWTGISRQRQFLMKRIWQPLDLALAAALLEREGFFVRILDNNIECRSAREIGEISAGFDQVFVTSSPYDRWQCPPLDIGYFFDTLSHIPKDRLYIMGVHATERPEALLRRSKARAAILKEPEQTVLDIACNDTDGDLSRICGVAFLRDGRLIRSPSRPFFQDLDRMPYPAYHLLPMNRYGYPFMGRPFAILEASRGCPFRCSFCYLGMHGGVYRQKSLDRFVREVVYVHHRFGVKEIYFMDLEIGLKRDYLLAFCREINRSGISLRWCCQTRVTDVDEEVIGWMKKAGCTLIHFGVEAGSGRILQETGKRIGKEACIRAVRLAKNAGIRTALFMNFGFPGETREEMEETIDFALRLDPTYASFHLIIPYPGTRLAEEAGLDPEMFPAHRYPQLNFFHHDPAQLKRMLRKAYRKFYLRPGFVRNLLKEENLFRPEQVKVFFQAFLG